MQKYITNVGIKFASSLYELFGIFLYIYTGTLQLHSAQNIF